MIKLTTQDNNLRFVEAEFEIENRRHWQIILEMLPDDVQPRARRMNWVNGRFVQSVQYAGASADDWKKSGAYKELKAVGDAIADADRLVGVWCAIIAEETAQKTPTGKRIATGLTERLQIAIELDCCDQAMEPKNAQIIGIDGPADCEKGVSVVYYCEKCGNAKTRVFLTKITIPF